jgi:hypothetical protein
MRLVHWAAPRTPIRTRIFIGATIFFTFGIFYDDVESLISQYKKGSVEAKK